MAGNKLLRIDLVTGTVKEICDAGNNPRGASWNTAGTILFGATASPLQRVPAGWRHAGSCFGPRQAEITQYPQFTGRQTVPVWSRGETADMAGVYAGTSTFRRTGSRGKILASPFHAVYATVPRARRTDICCSCARQVFAQPSTGKS